MIAAHLPRLDIFEKIASPGDLEAVLELEQLTNPRLNVNLGAIARIAVSDRVLGPGADFVMAAFAYPRAARFNDDQDGAYYAAEDLNTAVAEVSFHRTRLFRETPTPPQEIDVRVIMASIEGDLEDLRKLPATSSIYDPDNYEHARAEGRRVRAAGTGGVVYRSVRRRGGTCVAIFIPRLISNARTWGFLGMRWTGTDFGDVYTKDAVSHPYSE